MKEEVHEVRSSSSSVLPSLLLHSTDTYFHGFVFVFVRTRYMKRTEQENLFTVESLDRVLADGELG